MKTKAKSKVLGVLLACMLVIGLFPTTVLAVGGTSVKINGQELKSGESYQYGEGTALFDSQTNTLTLENATIEGNGVKLGVLRINGDLTVELKGNNTISSTDERVIYAGISSGGTADITIKGTNEDKLTITCDSAAIQTDGGNITIDGCTLDVTSHNWGGIGAYEVNNGNDIVGGKLSIQNHANVTVNSNELALVGEKGISISDSTVVATVNGQSNALYSKNNMIDISNSTVEAYAVSDNSYPAIWANALTVSNKSNVTADSNGSNGIYILNQCEISDSTLKVQGYYDAIFGDNDINIVNSKIESTSTGNQSNYAIYSNDHIISVTGNSDITANAGMDADQIVISPTTGQMLEVKVGNMAEGETGAEHFNDSPYTEPATFTGADDLWTYTYVHIKPHTHTGGTATCTDPAICDDCGKPYGNALGHKAVKTEAKAPTCTEDGNIEYWYCDACGKYFSDEALTEEIIKEKIVIKATGHGETELKNAKEATCTEEGYTGDKVCKVCGEVLEKGTVIEKIAHTFGEWTVTKEPTATEKGEKQHTCTICGYVEKQEIPATGTPTNPSEGNGNSPIGTTDPKDPTTDNQTVSDTSNKTNNKDVLNTGDDSSIALWVTVMLGAGAILTGTVLYNRKKRYNK
ncbi:hypothetical protein [Massilimicrobiota sp. SW1139]|uniref:hypothetical protein n=1 Tax=Massilimicrobiota sp. SW1139 TaxID=2530043 RepID=UPI00143BC594|nr:hypothetical protein [Massilimicrobiota sp. SW1139]NJE45089.1 hypothetical protein [Massilimicrobiota sp. SW1139]